MLLLRNFSICFFPRSPRTTQTSRKIEGPDLIVRKSRQGQRLHEQSSVIGVCSHLRESLGLLLPHQLFFFASTSTLSVTRSSIICKKYLRILEEDFAASNLESKGLWLLSQLSRRHPSPPSKLGRSKQPSSLESTGVSKYLRNQTPLDNSKIIRGSAITNSRFQRRCAK